MLVSPRSFQTSQVVSPLPAQRPNVLLDIDFRNEPALDIAAGGDGNVTIQSRTWVASNTARADVLDIAAAGLRIHPTAVTDLFDGRPDLAVGPFLSLNDLHAQFNIEEFGFLACRIFVDQSSANLANEHVGFTFEDEESVSFTASAGLGGATADIMRGWRSNIMGDTGSVGTHDVILARFQGLELRTYTGDYDDGFPVKADMIFRGRRRSRPEQRKPGQ